LAFGGATSDYYLTSISSSSLPLISLTSISMSFYFWAKAFDLNKDSGVVGL
jgi:hypothetical protein